MLNELILGIDGIFASSETTDFLRKTLPKANSSGCDLNEWKEVVLRLAERLLEEYLSSDTFNSNPNGINVPTDVEREVGTVM